MAAVFAGKWDLLETNNVEEILKATGVKSEFLELASSMVANQDEVLEEISVAGDKLTISYYKNRTKVDTEELTVGTTTESETVDGRKVQVSVAIEGNKLIFKESGPFDLTVTMEVKGDTANTTFVCGSTKATATLKKI